MDENFYHTDRCERKKKEWGNAVGRKMPSPKMTMS